MTALHGTARETWDYVIVGAGSAGCVLAERLTQAGTARVLLLEAGAWDRDPWIRIPLGFGRIRQRRSHDWGYLAEPQDSMGGRRVEYRRGKVVGGSSSINAMVYVRGHRSDYDRWAAAGLPGWSFADVLPLFQRQERWEHGADAFRGGSGPVHTRTSRYQDPLLQGVMQAMGQFGIPEVPDYNGPEQHGWGVLQFSIRDGRRCSAADAFLRPALQRDALTVRTETLVTKVVVERGRAVAVDYLQRGVPHRVDAAREVILCGGVINSPQLLMLSGIGDPQELARHGIPVVQALPGVGRNLQDHVMAPLYFTRKGTGSLHRHMRMDRIAWDLARAWFAGSGFATDIPSPLAAFLKTDPAEPVPDLQVLLHGGPVTAHPYLRPFRPPYDDGFSLLVTLLRPRSRGRLLLRSANPADPVRIEPNLLTDPQDVETLGRGVRLVRDIARQSALAPFIGRPLAFEGSAPAADELTAYLRSSAATVHHPSSTCRMGADGDPGAVVDGDLRVRGIDGLRVVDASVMPDLVGGNINAAVMMIAEKAAGAILA